MNSFRDHVVKSVKPRGSDRTGLLSKTLLNINSGVGRSRIFGCMCATHDPPPHRSPEVHPRWIFHSCWLTVCTFISWLIYSKFPFVVLVISVACKRTLAFPSARGDSSYSRHAVFWTKSTVHHYMERSFYSRFICFIWVCGKHTIILRVLVARGAGAEITEKLSRFV